MTLQALKALRGEVARIRQAMPPPSPVVGVMLRPGLTEAEARERVASARARLVYVANLGGYDLGADSESHPHPVYLERIPT